MPSDLDRDSAYAHYLWHLHDAGVIALSLKSEPGGGPPHRGKGPGRVPRYAVEGAVWDRLYGAAPLPRPSLVAVIDNGCCTTHPHLPPDDGYGGGLVEAPCFASHDFGALHLRPDGKRMRELPREAQATDRREGARNHFETAAETTPKDKDGKGFWQRIEALGPRMDEMPEEARATAAPEGALNHFKAAADADAEFWGRIKDLAVKGGSHAPMDRLKDIIASLHTTPGVVRAVTSYAEDFPVHGTLTAGVIAARPPEGSPEALPYFGVDPRARVLALNTSLRPAFRGLIHALLYAVGRDADVYCIPRAIWRPDFHDGEADPHHPHDRRASRLDTDLELQADGALFHVLLHVIAERWPVFLAAGNNGLAQGGVYPAEVARPDNGLISVGAITGRGIVASYSNTAGVTLYAPSDDAEAWDRAQRRLDPRGRTAREHPVPEALEPDQADEPYSGWGVLSTDIPGAFGDESGGLDLDEETDEPSRGAFAPFGGTSAACAIAAGVASLIQAARMQAGREPMTGLEMKRHMLEHGRAPSKGPGGERLLGPDGEAVVALDAKSCVEAVLRRDAVPR